MYNAVVVSVFEKLDVGCIECKNLVAIPFRLRRSSFDTIFSELVLQRLPGCSHILALKFEKIKGLSPFIKKFELLHKNYDVAYETDWYINPRYDQLKFGTLHKLADPSIILRSDTKRLKRDVKYYVDLILDGYSEEEAMNMLFN